MSNEVVPARRVLRKILQALLPTYAKLEGFCLDYFAQVATQISPQTERVAIENLLFKCADDAKVYQCLVSEFSREEVRRHVNAALAEDSQRMGVPSETTKPSAQSPGDTTPYPASPYATHYYIARTNEERNVRDALRSHTSVLITAPIGYGKSWFLRHTLEQQRKSGIQVVCFDLNGEYQQSLNDPRALLRSLLHSIFRELGLPAEVVDRAFRDSDPGASMNRVVEENLLINHVFKDGRKVALAIDNLDRIAGQSSKDDFFSTLRRWDTDTFSPIKKHLFLLAAASTRPSMFVANSALSPFNTARVIDLPAFTRHQIDELASLYPGMKLRAADHNSIEYWLSGHPSLVHLLLHTSHVERKPPSELIPLPPKKMQPELFRPFLDKLRNYLVNSFDGRLFDAFTLLANNPYERVDQTMLQRLESAGLIVWDQSKNGAFLRHQIYTFLLRQPPNSTPQWIME